MSKSCPDCGVVNEGDGTCRDLFDSFLNLEFTNPEYGEVHPLTVGIYMIQHYQYNDAALAWLRETLKEYLSNNWTAEKLRQVAEKSISNHSAKSEIIRSENSPPPNRLKWKMTIADVAENYESAKSYHDLIKEWAIITLQQLDENMT
jgi:hypothetical protein